MYVHGIGTSFDCRSELGLVVDIRIINSLRVSRKQYLLVAYTTSNNVICNSIKIIFSKRQSMCYICLLSIALFHVDN